MGQMLDAKIKEKRLVNKSDICNLAKNSDLDAKINVEVNEEQDKIVKLEVLIYMAKVFLKITACKII